MFATTFYSYKGGVGRTLALANVAALLARRDKKVLVVDFDLEAPGLQAMDAFRTSAGKPGVIDFVQSYVEGGEVPEVTYFIHSCEIAVSATDDPQSDFADEPRRISIDIMPAGGDDETYANRFAAVDWNRLYEEQNGFLLMEEMRTQWALAGYDYVLIDSRTGHTDVGGICTRQLPDAVVAVFFPNEQNLVGLSQVVSSVRSSTARESPIALIFAASRVPKLDDEHGHLRYWLEQAQQRLGYEDQDLVVVEHYDSLMLLNQVLFALARPRSGLAGQYQQLELQIAKRNSEDAEGALAFVQEAARPNSGRGTSLASGPRPEAEHLLSRLKNIGELHQQNPRLQHALARAFYQKQSLEDAALASDRALAGYNESEAGKLPSGFVAIVNRLRLRIFAILDDHLVVEESALAILKNSTASEEAVLDAMLTLASSNAGRLPRLDDIPALEAAGPERLLAMATRLGASPAAARTAADIAAVALGRADPQALVDANDRTDLQLLLIAGGRFDLALETGASSEKQNLADRFNEAVARWGLVREPDIENFKQIAAEIEGAKGERSEANLLQCAALAWAVLGERDRANEAAGAARTIIAKQAHREFSCWTYFNVQPTEFRQHLDEIVRFAAGGPPPEVLARAWSDAEHASHVNAG